MTASDRGRNNPQRELGSRTLFFVWKMLRIHAAALLAYPSAGIRNCDIGDA